MIKVLVFAAALLGVDGTPEEWPANTGVTHVVEEVQIGNRIIVIEQTHPDPNGLLAEFRKNCHRDRKKKSAMNCAPISPAALTAHGTNVSKARNAKAL